MNGRQKLNISAVIGLALWLLAVVAVVFWWHPRFWVVPDQEFRRAEVLLGEGRPDAALASIDRALADAPDTVGYLVFKGYLQLDVDRPADAERTFRDALRLRPSDVEGQLGFATALARQQQREAALAALQSLSVEAISEAQLRRRSQLYAMLMAPLLALDDLTQLLNRNPDNPDLLQEAAVLARSQQNWDQLASLSLRLGSATADPQVKAWAADARGEALEATGRLDEAREVFQEGNNPDRLESRAALAMRLRRYGEAADLYAELVQANPAESRFRRSLAFAQQEAGRTRRGGADVPAAHRQRRSRRRCASDTGVAAEYAAPARGSVERARAAAAASA